MTVDVKVFLLNAASVHAGPASLLAGWQPVRASKLSEPIGL